MKYRHTLLIVPLIACLLFSQTSIGNAGLPSCPEDTVSYPYAKMADTDSFTFEIVDNQFVFGQSQKYELNHPVNVQGFEFIATFDTSMYPNDTTFPVKAAIYTDDGTGLPGTMLASDTLMIDSSQQAPGIKRVAMFQTPITISANFVLTVESLQPDTVLILFNNPATNDGHGENLSGVETGAGWQKWMGFGEDQDALFSPIVDYSFNVDFSSSDTVICDSATVNFNNLSSSILSNRMFNRAAFDSFTTIHPYQWLFGDGNMSNLENPSHFYDIADSFKVSLYGRMYGWRSTLCTGEDSLVIEVIDSATANFGYITNNYTVEFSDSSLNANSYKWYFGDGDSSTQVNPNHTYSDTGTYPVTLKVSNFCGTDSVTKNVTVTCAPPTAGFTAADTGLEVDFSNTSTDAAGYKWHFGDGDTSTTPDPTHTYNSEGTYTVMLVANSVCGSDTTRDTLDITTGMASRPHPSLRINPVPAKEQLNIRVKGGATLRQGRLTLVNILGNVVYSQVLGSTMSQQRQLQIPVQPYPAGIYFVKLQNNHTTRVRKVIIQ